VRRGQWIKRSLLAVALVLTATAALSYWAFKGTPDYYVRPHLSDKERVDAANSAFEKFRQGREWANDLWVSEQRAILADSGHSATRPSTAPSPGQLTITFTDHELNAFCDQWVMQWEQRFKDMLRDPAIILRKDRIILAGTVSDLGTVASFHFVPRIDARGKLLLTLDSVRAGRLPMPELVWAAQRDRVINGLLRRLPGWQQKAQIEPYGVASREAVAAHMSKLLFDVLDRRPREPTLFIPLQDSRAVPVRLTAVRVTDGELTLTVEPMAPADRAALLQRIREPVQPVTASAQ
jgi:hypothetical protein